MKRKILIGVGVVIGIFVVAAATRPATFHVERSIVIAAPPENAFAQVEDFHAWSTWSPYDKLDPDLKRTYSGPTAGVGSHYAWSGNSKAGEGAMTIQKSEKNARIEIELAFSRPMKSTNLATFTFEPAAGGTKVTWAMDGKNSFVSKAASLFFDIDKLVGTDFEKGLAAIKTNAETIKPTTQAAAH